MKIQQRLTRSSLITVGIAIIFLFFISSMYNRTLTYYAFPQGDLGIGSPFPEYQNDDAVGEMADGTLIFAHLVKKNMWVTISRFYLQPEK